YGRATGTRAARHPRVRAGVTVACPPTPGRAVPPPRRGRSDETRRRRVDLRAELGHLVLAEVRDDVRLADHAHQPMVLDDRQPADLVVGHHPHHLGHVRLGVDPDRGPAGELTGGRGPRVAALGHAPDRDVAVGDDAVQAVILSADRQGADLVLAHLLRRQLQGVVLLDALGTPVHDVPGV